jgi:hypothetical protein
MKSFPLALIPVLVACAADPLESDLSDDVTALTVNLTDEPPATSTSTTATFMYTVNMKATITCRLDGQPFETCPKSPATFTALADGPHTFDLKATSGKQHVAIPTYAFTVDTTAPIVTIASGPASPTSATSATFAFTAGDATAVTCELDDLGQTACTSPAWYTGLTNGNHTFTLRGTDAAGNTGSAIYPWTIDSIAPTVTITSTPGSYGASTATFGFAATTNSATQCSLDYGVATPCTGSITYTGLADGAHVFSVTAVDEVGNTAIASYSWAVDTHGPTISALTYNCDSSTGELDVYWTVSDTGSGIAYGTCTYPTGTYAGDCTYVTSWSGSLRGANQVFTVSYTDLAGHTATRSRTISSVACL